MLCFVDDLVRHRAGIEPEFITTTARDIRQQFQEPIGPHIHTDKLRSHGKIQELHDPASGDGRERTFEKSPGMSQCLAMNLVSIFGLTALLLLSACDREAIPSPSSQASAAAQEPSGQPQPKLPTIKLGLGPQEITAEQALTEKQVQTGMMFRQEMAEHEGMLFVLWNGPMRASFWMRNTLLPLSCAYIDPEGVILEIHDMKPLDETPIEAQTDRVQYVLEVKQGWFERNRVNAGMRVRTEHGTLRETYFRR